MDPKTPVRSLAKEPEKMCVSDIKKDNKAKGWFLTYPQCPAPAQDVLEDLRDKLKNRKSPLTIVEYVICEEKHENGDPHLHAFIKLDKRVRFDARMFDIIYEGKDYHGNYQVAKSWDAVKQYVKKGNNYISSFDTEKALMKKGKITIDELKMDPLEALEKGIIGGMQLANFVKNHNMLTFLENKRKADAAIDLEIEKKRHFWYYGPSNSGKTYRIKKMRKDDAEKPEGEREGWFQMPTNNDWNGYNGEKNLYIDEFKGNMMEANYLNRICDGNCKVNTKGGSLQLRSDIVVWVCSNYNIGEVYKNIDKELKEGLYNRFNEKLCTVSECDGKKIYGVID